MTNSHLSLIFSIQTTTKIFVFRRRRRRYYYNAGVRDLPGHSERRGRGKNALSLVPHHYETFGGEGERARASQQSRMAILRTPPHSPRTERKDRSINDDPASAFSTRVWMFFSVRAIASYNTIVAHYNTAVLLYFVNIAHWY